MHEFKKTDAGIYGKAFEMEIKKALNRRNADKVSPCGSSDFIYNRKHYDCKQNGSILQYAPGARYIKGSNRVIFATHIACTVIENDESIFIDVDLANTSMHVVDRNEFIKYLDSINATKHNLSRGTVNIQTMWNYKKNKHHGKLAERIEHWCFANELDDDIIDEILEAVWE